jgi:hypothetical protein
MAGWEDRWVWIAGLLTGVHREGVCGGAGRNVAVDYLVRWQVECVTWRKAERSHGAGRRSERDRNSKVKSELSSVVNAA